MKIYPIKDLLLAYRLKMAVPIKYNESSYNTFWRNQMRANILCYKNDEVALNKYLFDLLGNFPTLIYIMECLLIREFPQLTPKLNKVKKIMLLQ